MIRQFEGVSQAEFYQKYRPNYPAELYEKIVEFVHRDGQRSADLAVDVACGTGQSTRPLAAHFTKVIGLDVSPAQIEQARQASTGLNVEYRSGPGEDLSFLESSTVDLITVATGIHWMDRPKFYEEVKRVLKPGGGLVAYGYDIPDLDNEAATARYRKFYTETLGDWLDRRIQLLEDRYRDLTLPFDDCVRDTSSLVIRRKVTIDGFIGYISSYSGYNELIKAHPESKVLSEFADDLKCLYRDGEQKSDGDGGEKTECELTYQVFYVMGRKQ